jgi:hypothetical protein
MDMIALNDRLDILLHKVWLHVKDTASSRKNISLNGLYLFRKLGPVLLADLRESLAAGPVELERQETKSIPASRF